MLDVGDRAVDDQVRAAEVLNAVSHERSESPVERRARAEQQLAELQAGRGAYRAMVAARYDDAVRRGTPMLVVQASARSRPILERLGFAVTAEVRILADGPST